MDDKYVYGIDPRHKMLNVTYNITQHSLTYHIYGYIVTWSE